MSPLKCALNLSKGRKDLSTPCKSVPCAIRDHFTWHTMKNYKYSFCTIKCAVHFDCRRHALWDYSPKVVVINFFVLTSYPGRDSEEAQMQHSQYCYFLSSMQIDLSAICNERHIMNYLESTVDWRWLTLVQYSGWVSSFLFDIKIFNYIKHTKHAHLRFPLIFGIPFLKMQIQVWTPSRVAMDPIRDVSRKRRRYVWTRLSTTAGILPLQKLPLHQPSI